MMLALLPRPQWLQRAQRAIRLALLRTHYRQIKLACEAAALDPAPDSGQRLCTLVCRGIEVRERIAELEGAGR